MKGYLFNDKLENDTRMGNRGRRKEDMQSWTTFKRRSHKYVRVIHTHKIKTATHKNSNNALKSFISVEYRYSVHSTRIL